MTLKTDKYVYEGAAINLRPIIREDYTVSFLRWANDPEFNRYLSHGLRTTTKEMMDNLFDELSKKENRIFAIVVPKTEKTIGIIGLHQFNRVNSSCEYAIHIGEKEFWGGGAASEATEFILRYGFTELGFHKIWLGVNEDNARAVKFYEKNGFVREGVLRDECINRDGKYSGSVRMSVLRGEYDKKRV